MGLFGNNDSAQVNKSGMDNVTLMKILKARMSNINQHSVRDFFQQLAKFYSLGYRFDQATRDAVVYYVNEVLKKVEPKLKSNPGLLSIAGNKIENFYDRVAEMRWIKEKRQPSSSELEKCGNFLYDMLAA